MDKMFLVKAHKAREKREEHIMQAYEAQRKEAYERGWARGFIWGSTVACTVMAVAVFSLLGI